MTIQANAEGQGGTLKALHPDRADELNRLSEIEIGSADDLDALLPTLSG